MKTQKPYYITTEKISVGYDGKPLIEEVEIALRKGEILTLLGPNGAGKSTILKSIARQLSLIAGTVRLDAVSTPQMPPPKRGRPKRVR